MTDGIKLETIRRGQEYRGRIAVYSDGKRCYSLIAETRRISRGDALRDARQMANDLIRISFYNGVSIYPDYPPEGESPNV